MQLLTDGVHCRECDGTGPIVRKVVAVRALPFQVQYHHGPFFVRLSVPTPTSYGITNGYVVVIAS